MLKFLKNIVLGVVTTAALIAAGSNTIEAKTQTEVKQSSYTLTSFDYVVISPSKDQVISLKENKEAVNSIFPCYLFDSTLSGVNKSRISLLLSDDISDYQTGLFNEKTLTAGSFDENGICLDKTAAESLGAGIGSKVTTALGGRNFTFTVTSIYMASTYVNMDAGLALANYSQEIADAFCKELSYNCAFIDANDETKCAEALKDYKPLGQLISEENYISSYKANNNLPGNMSEEEWDASIKKAYEEYKDQFLNQTFANVVQVKSEYMKDISDQIQTTTQSINYICVGVGVGALVLYLALSIIFMFANKSADIDDSRNGKKNQFVPYYLLNCIEPVSISLITGIGLFIRTSSSQFFSTYKVIIASFSLPVLAAIPLMLIVTFIYEGIIDKSSNDDNNCGNIL